MTDDNFTFDPAARSTRKVEREDHNTGERQHDDFYFDPNNKPGALAKHIIDTRNPRTGLVKAWSPSVLKNFETCRYRVYLDKVAKFHQEQTEPLKRGIEWHEACEFFVDGRIAEFPEAMMKSPKFKPFVPSFEHLREEFAESRVDLEGEWGFNQHWEPTDWRSRDTWARMKLDALHWTSETTAKIIDYKTGRKFGNEIAHADQGMQYTVAAFMRHKQLEQVEVSFWYLDQNEVSFPQFYSRQQAAMFLPRITERAVLLTTADTEDFVPSPSAYTCNKCPFNRDIEGCEWRHRR